MSTQPPLYERIYAVVRQIPRGKVASYGQIARLVGGCSAQMIGFAMAGSGAHSDVPWQRVINAQGKISPRIGFGGLLQRELLEEEGVTFDAEDRVDFEKFGWAIKQTSEISKRFPPVQPIRKISEVPQRIMIPDPLTLQTPITHLLDSQKIRYRRLPHREAVFTVEAAAKTRGVVMEEMVKSILLREKDSGENTRYVMACVPGHARLLPQTVRAYLPGNWRRLTFSRAEEIQTVTGSVQGAVAPLCLPAHVPVVFDEVFLQFDKVSISSGDPWLGLELDPAALFRLAHALMGKISE